jgi:6-phosphogluconolactonase (cycloisomerase 2 family)
MTPDEHAILRAVQVLSDAAGVDGPRSVAISPEGAHVYVAARGDDALAVFLRDADSGELTFANAKHDGIDGVEGLFRPTSVALSPDGRNVYVTAADDDAVTVFARDGDTGELTFVESKVDGEAGTDALDEAASVVVSPDAKHVYVAARRDDAVSVFARDASTGSLDLVEVRKNRVDGVSGLFGATCVALSPDGLHLYVASFVDSAIAVFERDPTSGSLAFIESHENGENGVDGLRSAASVTVSPHGTNVYATGFLDDAVVVFTRDAQSGALTFLESLADGEADIDGLEGASWVTVKPNDRYVYVAGSIEGAIAVFSRHSENGSLTFVGTLKEGVGNVEGLEGATSIAFSPDESHLYVAAEFDDAVTVLTVSEGGTALNLVEAERGRQSGIDALSGARSVTISPDGKHLYVAAYQDSAVAVFSRDAERGTLTFVEASKDGIDGVTGLSAPYDVALSPDGAHAYVPNWGPSVVVLARNQEDGTLTFVEVQEERPGGPQHLAGALSAAVSPDGTHVYVATWFGDAVVVFSRNTTSGALSFVEELVDGEGNVEGLSMATSVLVSPDGGHVYVTAGMDDAVSVFARDADTGKLSFVETLEDGQNGIVGMDDASGAVCSPDGSQVYVTASRSNAVSMFERNTETGVLAQVETEWNGYRGVDGLAGASSAAVSIDGTFVYVVGYDDDAVIIFSRSESNGRLRFLDQQRDGIGGVTGMNGPRSVAVAPQGKHVYVATELDDSVVVFERVREPCAGDCNRDTTVTVDELVTGVNIALGNLSITACTAFDPGGDDLVTVDELVKAVNIALGGCRA